MERDKIEFDIRSVDDTEYKLREIASLSPEEVDKLEKEKQVLFISIRDDIEPISNMLIMAPKAWFGGEMDFRYRVQTDLKEYVTNAITHLFDEGVDNICEMIDHMGLIPFINYISLELMKQFSYPLDDTDEFEDFGKVDNEKASELKLLTCQILNNTLICNKLLYDDDALGNIMEQAEIVTGVMCVQSEYGSNMKESYVMKIRLLNNYASVEEPDVDFVEDVKSLYINFLDEEA